MDVRRFKDLRPVTPARDNVCDRPVGKRDEGERLLAAQLVRSVGNCAVLLYDRSIPETRANVDHLAIGASDIWMIDAKSYKAKVE
jgi:hypothetical protein